MENKLVELKGEELYSMSKERTQDETIVRNNLHRHFHITL